MTLNLANKSNPITPGGTTVITPQWITDTVAAMGYPGITLSISATFADGGALSLTLGGSVAALLGQYTSQIPPLTWAENGDILTITANGVVTTLTHSVGKSTMTVTASWAQLQQLLSDGAASQGMTPEEVKQRAAEAAAELGFTVDEISNVTVTGEFTR